MIFDCHVARITPSAAVYGRAGCITFHYLQFGRTLGIPFTTTNNSFLHAGMSDCPAPSQCGTGMNKYLMPEPVRYRNKGTQSGTGMLRYRTEIQVPEADAGGIDLDADAQL